MCDNKIYLCTHCSKEVFPLKSTCAIYSTGKVSVHKQYNRGFANWLNNLRAEPGQVRNRVTVAPQNSDLSPPKNQKKIPKVVQSTGVTRKSIPPGKMIPLSNFDTLAFKNYCTSKIMLL